MGLLLKCLDFIFLKVGENCTHAWWKSYRSTPANQNEFTTDQPRPPVPPSLLKKTWFTTLPETNIAHKNPPVWWYLQYQERWGHPAKPRDTALLPSPVPSIIVHCSPAFLSFGRAASVQRRVNDSILMNAAGQCHYIICFDFSGSPQFNPVRSPAWWKISWGLIYCEGKNGFASCTFILMWCGRTMRLRRIVVDRCFFERLCTDAPAPPAAGAKEFRLRRVGRKHPQRHHEAQKGNSRNMIIFMLSNLKRAYYLFQPHVNAHSRDPTICHEKAFKC